MAPRLTVIISQSSGGHARSRDVEEELLTQLLLAPGLDATLTASLDSIEPEHTDYLCLSGVTQSLALVSSLDYQQVVAQWERLQLGGQVIRFGQSSAGAERRVYYFALQSGAASIVSHLKELLGDMSVQTVNLLLPTKVTAGAKQSLPLKVLPQATPTPPSLPSKLTTSASAPEAEVEWPDIEKLVDDFDALDW